MTILEQMAKADYDKNLEIARARDPRYADAWHPWDELQPHDKERILEALRAGLKVLREPNDAMLTAAIAPYREGNTPEFNEVFKKTVAGYMAAMLDVVITEKP